MTVKADKKLNIEEGNMLYLAWVDLNKGQFRTTIHIIEDLSTFVYKDSRRRHGIPEDSAITINGNANEKKLLFPMLIVEYNQYMGRSDSNAQQRSYYNPRASDRRY